MVSHSLIAKVAPEWRLNLGFGTQTKCPFLLNRGVPSIYKKTDFFNFSFKGTRIVQAKTNASGFCVTVRGRPSWELWAAPLSAHAYLAACSLSTCELVSTCAVDVAKSSVLFVWSRRKVPLGRVAGTTKRAPWHQCRPRSLERIINVNNLRCSVSGRKAENHLLYITSCEL